MLGGCQACGTSLSMVVAVPWYRRAQKLGCFVRKVFHWTVFCMFGEHPHLWRPGVSCRRAPTKEEGQKVGVVMSPRYR